MTAVALAGAYSPGRVLTQLVRQLQSAGVLPPGTLADALAGLDSADVQRALAVAADLLRALGVEPARTP